jgi:hypothetical protein
MACIEIEGKHGVCGETVIVFFGCFFVFSMELHSREVALRLKESPSPRVSYLVSDVPR